MGDPFLESIIKEGKILYARKEAKKAYQAAKNIQKLDYQ